VHLVAKLFHGIPYAILYANSIVIANHVIKKINEQVEGKLMNFKLD